MVWTQQATGPLLVKAAQCHHIGFLTPCNWWDVKEIAKKKQECETKTQGKCRAIQKFCTICRASSRIEANRRLWIGLNPGLLVLTSNLPGCMIALKGIRDLFFSSPIRALSGQKGGLQGLAKEVALQCCIPKPGRGRALWGHKWEPVNWSATLFWQLQNLTKCKKERKPGLCGKM